MIWVTWPLDIQRKEGESTERGEREPKANERIAGDQPVHHLYFDSVFSPSLEVQVRLIVGIGLEVVLVDTDGGEILGRWTFTPEPHDEGPHPERGLHHVAAETEAFLGHVAASVDKLERSHYAGVRGVHREGS